MSRSMITEEAVIEEVKKEIAETLNIDKNGIQPDNSLIKDLGAESLDFLDVNYRLEQAFGVKMARHFVLQHIEEMFGEGSAIDENSQLTDKAVSLLKIRLGGNLPAELKAGVDMDEVPTLVTVQSIAKGVQDILALYSQATCPCRACQALPTLDLKLILHHGEFVLQQVAGIRDLLGTDVNLIHRLLKNGVSESTGWKGYALFTDQALEHMHCSKDNYFRRCETYEHLGKVNFYCMDMHVRYEEMKSSSY